MSMRRGEACLLILPLLLGYAAFRRWRSALPPIGRVTPVIGAIQSPPRRVQPESLDDMVDLTIDNDPFRLSGSPSTLPYVRSAALQSQPPAISSAPRPPLFLKAIVGGPPWQAIVDGIPGQPPGTIVVAGSTFDKLRVRSVSRDTVVVQGPDTLWKLTLPRSGK